MININNHTKEYILDLNDSMDSHRELSVNSSTKWLIAYVSSPLISARSFSNSNLSIDIVLNELKEDAYLMIRNLQRETMTIAIKPNIQASREKEYVFKIWRKHIDGKKVTLTITSKENGEYEPWELTKDGYPLSYSMKIAKTTLDIELASILASECYSVFELTQINSGKKIHFQFRHKDNGSVEFMQEKD